MPDLRKPVLAKGRSPFIKYPNGYTQRNIFIDTRMGIPAGLGVFVFIVNRPWVFYTRTGKGQNNRGGICYDEEHAVFVKIIDTHMPISNSPPLLGSSTIYDGTRLHHRKNASSTAEAVHQPFYRDMAIFNYAQVFYGLTAGKTDQDEDRLKLLCMQVRENGVADAFNRDVVGLAKRNGLDITSTEAIIDQEFGRHSPERFFKSALRKNLKNCLDGGQRKASPWEYRRYGMWRAVADFFGVCRDYPVMSAGVVGLVAYFGHKYPFLGGISGSMIIAWGFLASLANEWKARLKPSNAQDKSAYYVRSGENLAAALITCLGLKGIVHGSINGVEDAKAAITALPNATRPKKLLSATTTAITATSKEKHKTTLLESALFVSGLFDNVLLPFNWLADTLKKSH